MFSFYQTITIFICFCYKTLYFKNPFDIQECKLMKCSKTFTAKILCFINIRMYLTNSFLCQYLLFVIAYPLIVINKIKVL